MRQYQVVSEALTHVNGEAVQVGDEIALSGAAARKLVAAGHVTAVETDAGEVDAADPLASTPKQGAKQRAAKKAGAKKSTRRGAR